VNHFLESKARDVGAATKRLTREAMDRVMSYSWPGNVRELENVLGHACMLAAGDVIDIAELPAYLRQAAQAKPAEVITFPGPQTPQAAPEPAGLSFDEQERRVVEAALARTGGNQVRAAQLLGISRDKLRYKIKKHNLR